MKTGPNQEVFGRTARKPRWRDTESQIEELIDMDDEELIENALVTVQALDKRTEQMSRRKKVSRRQAWECIYIRDMRDAFLEELVVAGRANVYQVDIYPPANGEPCYQRCSECDRTWYGSSWCLRCAWDYGCPIPTAGYRIDCGNGIRFDLSILPGDISFYVDEGPAQDPAEPPGEIPRVGLTIAAQKFCVGHAIERLEEANARGSEESSH